MRIAFIAPYQGVLLLQRRPTLKNLALAANSKMETICQLLQTRGHQVEILSQGEVVEHQAKLHPGFSERAGRGAGVAVHYASALPVKFINGLWSSRQLLNLFKQRQAEKPFDLVIVYNLKQPQVACADYAARILKLPVILEYEDDTFVTVDGQREQGWRNRSRLTAARKVLNQVAGGIGVSPHILSQLPAGIPKLLLRGVVDESIVSAAAQQVARKPWVVYSGTHYRSKGLEPLITAWQQARLAGWELHLTGRGELTARLEKMAEHDPTIVFHGMLPREQLAAFLGEAAIGINPHDLSHSPGNVFAFKIIEYLAAGLHCITTPMGALEPELEAGLTYIPDNSPATIATALQTVISSRRYERLASAAALSAYGPEAVATTMDRFVKQVQATGPAGER